ncbi:response regulator [Saccharibacillus deserti]|uniref:response regulator n=1 Tax=Saccharibacillus deserti TaxID=1634444 RepID=UPI001554A244|nr:response regulator [Saccharibacillus deserti]
MRALLVDDEKLALLHLKNMLEQQNGVRVAGMFSDANRALEEIGETAPDIVFLDIEMPEIDGLELAARIRALDEAVDIVFTSGSVRHALDAYEFYPLDYMRKPINRQRLGQTLDRARHRLEHETCREANPNSSPVLLCLGPLRVHYPGTGAAYLKWRTSKAQELFAYLLHNRGRIVGRDELFGLLWNGFDSERAAAQLYNTVYTVRAVLKEAGLNISIVKGGPVSGYRLELGQVQLDVRQWEEEAASLPPIGPGTAVRYEAALSRYTGEYLSGHDYAWAESERDRLRRLWLGHARLLEEFYRTSGKKAEAEAVSQRVSRLSPVFRAFDSEPLDRGLTLG